MVWLLLLVIALAIGWLVGIALIARFLAQHWRGQRR
jgi:hypothetical protein